MRRGHEEEQLGGNDNSRGKEKEKERQNAKLDGAGVNVVARMVSILLHIPRKIYHLLYIHICR